MFGLVSKKSYNVLIEQNDMLSREVEHYQNIVMNTGFWLIQKNKKDIFKCSECKNETSFTLDNIPACCPVCGKHIVALKNDPFDTSFDNEEVTKLKKRK